MLTIGKPNDLSFPLMLQPEATQSTSAWAKRGHLTGQWKLSLPSPSRKVKTVLTIAGLGNMVWSSCLHSGGAREVEDTNRRFRSLQPSPEKEQKVSTDFFFHHFVFHRYNLLVFVHRDKKISRILSILGPA